MKVPERTITRYTLSLSAIVLIGASLRLYQLGTQSIWFDEAFSVWVAKAGVLQIIQTTAKDTHPPLYYFILHYWMAIFGDSELAVRGLSAFFGILAIPMVYVIGRQLFDGGVSWPPRTFTSLRFSYY